MYTLYINKDEKVLKVEKAKKPFCNLNYTDIPTFYNSNYYICENRKPLVELARELKNEWISNLETDLETVRCIKV